MNFKRFPWVDAEFNARNKRRLLRVERAVAAR